jgi:agmatinase
MKTDRTYAGIPNEFSTYEKSNVVLLPVPYDGTSTWQKGADKGPEAFLHASENMELYDIETKSEVYKEGIFLAAPLSDFATPEKMVAEVEAEVKEHLKRKKFVTLFGGEHSISIGAIKAFDAYYENLTVLQIDAHADLRSTYEGSANNHACAMHEASKTTNLIQVGIRSMDISERKYMDEEKVFFAQDISTNEFWIDNVVDLLTDNVYITIDLDGFDPSIMPATGTPEPGGLLWHETLELLRQVMSNSNVVGFDIVELCPNEGSKASDFLAAKLYYKLLSYKYAEDLVPEDLDEDGEPSGKKSSTFDDYEE